MAHLSLAASTNIYSNRRRHATVSEKCHVTIFRQKW